MVNGIKSLRPFIIKAKDYEFATMAKDAKDAFVNFFTDFVSEERAVESVGHIVIIATEDDEYGIRTVPTFVLLGVLSVSDGIFNIAHLFGIDDVEACQILQECMENDKWIAEKVKKKIKHD